jgi:hypothetical protein
MTTSAPPKGTKQVWKVIKWIVGIFIAIMGLVAFSQSFLGGLFTLLAALFTVPIVSDKLKEKVSIWNKKYVRIIVPIILFMVGMSIFGNSPAVKANTEEQRIEAENTKRAKKEDAKAKKIAEKERSKEEALTKEADKWVAITDVKNNEAITFYDSKTLEKANPDTTLWNYIKKISTAEWTELTNKRKQEIKDNLLNPTEESIGKDAMVDIAVQYAGHFIDEPEVVVSDDWSAVMKWKHNGLRYSNGAEFVNTLIGKFDKTGKLISHSWEGGRPLRNDDYDQMRIINKKYK